MAVFPFKCLWHCQYWRRVPESCIGSWLPLKLEENPCWFLERKDFCHTCLCLGESAITGISYHISYHISFHPEPETLEKWFYVCECPDLSSFPTTFPLQCFCSSHCRLPSLAVEGRWQLQRTTWCSRDVTWMPSDGRSLDLHIWP